MKRSTILNRLLLAGIVIAAASSPAPADARPAHPVPSTIAVPHGHKLFLAGHAIGVQIYSCDATSTGFAWTLVAPGRTCTTAAAS